MRSRIYTIHAYRYGDRELHSYSVGVSSKRAKALTMADEEKTQRGGKYECEVIEWEGDNYENHKVVLALPEYGDTK